MNSLIYNNDFITENKLTISPLNRALNYGDGLFETMILKEGKILYLDDHVARLTEGLKTLDIQLPVTFEKDHFTQQVITLATQNNLLRNARIKLQVWRKPGGLVTPESSEAEYLVSAMELKKTPEIKSRAFRSESVQLHQHSLSKFKTLNFLPYILAGIEKKKRNADEIILCDQNENISEASSSNLFWCKNDTLYTPSLATGCIDGILRKQILKFCAKENIKVQEGLFNYSELQKADLVFTSNVAGTSLIESLDDQKIDTQYTLYQAIRIGLDLL